MIGRCGWLQAAAFVGQLYRLHDCCRSFVRTNFAAPPGNGKHGCYSCCSVSNRASLPAVTCEARGTGRLSPHIPEPTPPAVAKQHDFSVSFAQTHACLRGWCFHCAQCTAAVACLVALLECCIKRDDVFMAQRGVQLDLTVDLEAVQLAQVGHVVSLSCRTFNALLNCQAACC